MNADTASTIQVRHAVRGAAETYSAFNRTCRGVLAGLGFATSLLASAPAMAQTYLGTAQSFAVLGGSTVTNTGPTVVTGDLGLSPGSAVVGFPPGLVTGGVIHVADPPAQTAQNDLTTAYNTLASQACTADLTGTDLGGLTLTPGVYCFSTSALLTGTLTLNAQGNPNAVFIFKIGSTLTTASNAAVSVINGGSTCGASWQVGTSATLGTATAFAGNIVALASITLNTGANVPGGRTLARNGAVTLDNSAVSNATCVGGGFSGTGLPGPGSGIPTLGGAAIPTLSEWAMILLAAFIGITGFAAMRRQAR